MLKINGRDYELRFTINTLCDMADSGIDVMHMNEIVINVKTIRELFRFGLKHQNKKITQNQAGDLIDEFFDEGGNFEELVQEVMGALAKSLGGKDEKDEVDEEVEGK